MRKFRTEGIKRRTDIAYELGLQNNFKKIIVESREQIAIRRCKDYINFIDTKNRLPSQVGTDEIERSLGRWMNNQRSIGIDRIYKSVIKLMDRAGYLHLFDRRNSEVNQLKKCEMFIEYVKIHKKSPSEKSSNQSEKKLGVQYMVFKIIKKSLKIEPTITEDDVKLFIKILNKMSVEKELYEFAEVLKDKIFYL